MDRGLALNKVDIATLSETQLFEQGQLEEVRAGYTFFWSGRLRAERRDAGVAFAVQNDIAGRLSCLPQAISDNLDAVQSMALVVVGRARRQHQDWSYDNDAAVSKLPAGKNRLHEAYITRPTDDDRAAFYRSRETQDTWTTRKAEEVQGYEDRNE
ncbi:hypothetical protein SprV_0802644200 [Sparganum proliferum]